MRDFIEFLSAIRITEVATQPVVLIAAVAVFIVAALMRWKLVLLLLFGLGGMLAVIRYAHIEQSHGPLDPSLAIFVVGAGAVGVVLIYFLFIRGD